MMNDYQNITIDNNVKNVYAIGDLHGYENIVMLNRHIKNMNITHSVMFLLGDNGMGFYINDYDDSSYKSFVNKELRGWKTLNQIGVNRDITFIAFRGNHDNPKVYDKDFVTPMVKQLSNVIFVDDFAHVTINSTGHKVICIGGGTSIDYMFRKPYTSYWFDEEVKDIPFDEWHDMCKEFQPNVILSHVTTAFHRREMGFGELKPYFADNMLIERLNKEYNTIGKYVMNIPCVDSSKVQYCFGHYHKRCDVQNTIDNRVDHCIAMVGESEDCIFQLENMNV